MKVKENSAGEKIHNAKRKIQLIIRMNEKWAIIERGCKIFINYVLLLEIIVLLLQFRDLSYLS